MNRKYLMPRIWLLVAALLWGGGFIGVQDALDHGWTAPYILAIRGILGGGLLLGIQWKTKWWKKPQLMRSGMLLGVFLFFGFALQTIGQALSSPSNSAFITALYIMMVPFIMRLYRKRVIVIDVYVAMLLAVVGIGVLTISDGLSFHMGDLLLVAGAGAFAIQIVLLEEIAIMHEPLSLAGIQLFTMGILGIGWIPFAKPIVPTGGIMGLLYISIFASCIAFLIQAVSQRIVPPSTTSLLLGAESILGSLLSVLLGYESFTIRLLIGGMLFVLAIFVCEGRPISHMRDSRD